MFNRGGRSSPGSEFVLCKHEGTKDLGPECGHCAALCVLQSLPVDTETSSMPDFYE